MNAAKAGFAALLALGAGACAPQAYGRTGTSATARDPLAAFAYPGATAAVPATFTASDPRRIRTLAGFTTTDAFAKVYDYYRRRLPAGSETMRVLSAKGSVATFYVESPKANEAIAVQISSDQPNVTEILLTRYSARAGLNSSERELMQ